MKSWFGFLLWSLGLESWVLSTGFWVLGLESWVWSPEFGFLVLMHVCIHKPHGCRIKFKYTCIGNHKFHGSRALSREHLGPFWEPWGATSNPFGSIWRPLGARVRTTQFLDLPMIHGSGFQSFDFFAWSLECGCLACIPGLDS